MNIGILSLIFAFIAALVTLAGAGKQESKENIIDVRAVTYKPPVMPKELY